MIFIQVLILNNIDFSGYITPYLYILAVMLLPFDTPKWLLLVVAFFSGIIIDMFSDTLGLHTFSIVLMAYLRPAVLNWIDTPKENAPGTTPLNNNFKLEWFVKYTGILTLVYHLSFEFMEAFSFSFFFSTVFKAIASSVFTMILILLTRFLTIKR